MKVVLKHNLKVSSKGYIPAGTYDSASGDIPEEIMAEVEAGAAIVEVIDEGKQVSKPPEKPLAGEKIVRNTGEQPEKTVKTPDSLMEEPPKRKTPQKVAPEVTETKSANKRVTARRRAAAKEGTE